MTRRAESELVVEILRVKREKALARLLTAEQRLARRFTAAVLRRLELDEADPPGDPAAWEDLLARIYEAGFDLGFDWPSKARRSLRIFERIAGVVRREAATIVSSTANLVARGVEHIFDRQRAGGIAGEVVASAMRLGRSERISEDAQFQTWVTVGDDRVREWHEEADGQTVPVFEPFDVGGELLLYPHDPAGSPENIINCRCWIEPA